MSGDRNDGADAKSITTANSRNSQRTNVWSRM